MEAKILLSLLFLAVSSNAAAYTKFKPAVLNAALLFDHDATTGDVKRSLQWIRDVSGKLMAMAEVKYDRSGCFTHVNMVDKANAREFHLENKNGVLSSFKGQRISGKVNGRCEITEFENEHGKFTLSYNVRGLLETVTNRETGEVVARYEYQGGQFPVRVRNYSDKEDMHFFYPYGSDQFSDYETVSKKGDFIFRIKESCSYTADGNVDKCSLISSVNKNYHETLSFWVSNHETEYF